MTVHTPRSRASIGDCTLARLGGATVIDVDGAEALAAEARACASEAVEARVDHPPFDDWDRGNPDRWLDSATGGERLRTLMYGDPLRRQLEALTGLRWEPLAQLGTYSYYRRPGHHLGLHRDIVGCDLSVVVVCDIAGDGAGGELITFPRHVRSPLSAVRSRPESGARVIDARPGQAAVLFGGLVPHRVVEITGERRRVVAPLCFTVRR